MIIVLVEHFLSEAGRQYFPAWIKEVETVLGRWDGFVKIEQIQDVESENSTHLLLQFESLALLRTWSKSEEHDQMIAKLTPFRLKKQQSRVFTALGE
jgi:antibiotic biosynthesis monooxygenase (ABM) superfamily enzyme